MVARFSSVFPRPSWGGGLARSAADSLYPELWRGKIGHWVPALGPTGVLLRDASGHNNHGTLTNMDPAADWVPSSLGWSLHLTAGTEAVVWDNNTLHDVQPPFSVGLWYKGPAGANAWIFSKNASNAYLIQVLQFNGEVNGWCGGANTLSVAVVDDDEWHHIMFVAHGIGAGLGQIFIDGVDSTSATDTTGTPVYDTNPLNLGSTDASNTPTADLNDIRLYNRALTPNEVHLLYEVPYADLILAPQIFAKVSAAAGRRVFSVA